MLYSDHALAEEAQMIPAVRRSQIKQMILEKKSLTVADVADDLGVSRETVRRDLCRLELEGVLTRTHGGAMIAHRMSPQTTNADLEGILVDAKMSIADQANSLVRPGLCLWLDSSTTSLTLARRIAAEKLTVVTNSLAILTELSTRPDMQLVAIGGTLSKTRRCFVGHSAREMLRNLHFDLAFMSCRTIDLDRGAMDSNEEEIEVKTTVLHRTNRLVVLADHSKFGRASFSRICDFSDIDHLITDVKPSQEWIDRAFEHSVRLSWDLSSESLA